MRNIYRRMKKHLTDENNNIIWRNFLTLLEKINTYRKDGSGLYEYIYRNPPK